MIDGESCYHRGHGACRFKGLHIPFGALVECMPQHDMAIDSFGSKTCHGLLLGYHVQPWGLWNGDYLVADYEPFKKDIDVLERNVKYIESKRC